ncbi:hypothetical protein [Alkalimonas mucilaginosa]|uniref:SURF1-like protein n=1 Tax=Alkalimonas mucilaginosa TaxID=3057676 RepID=A0ABU7JFK8_9GAMM|nr:hypothetical protein [Alkalimonas sp. MEB004]MEE2024412.1 hypothetical protein [Alkalimonas sp. MEB004]
MSKRRLCIALLLGSPVLSLVSLHGWQWYQTPRVTLSPELWQPTSSTNTAVVDLSFWTQKRHAHQLQLTKDFVLQSRSGSIGIRLTSLSYPSLYPSKVRVGFELLEPEDFEVLSQQQNFVLRPQG